MKRKLLYVNVIICLVLVLFQIFTLSSNVKAADAVIGVNGVNILLEESKMVQCGEGVALYDNVTQTLTLDNATISQPYKLTGIGIHANTDLKIVLKGNNIIRASGFKKFVTGIYTGDGGITISGSGKLEIDVEMNAIQNFKSSISISECEMMITSDVNGIAAHTDLSIDGAKKISIISKNRSISSADISGSTSIGSVKLKDTEIEVNDSVNTAIYSKGNIDIDNCKIVAKGEVADMRSEGDINISDSEIKCIGEATNALIGIGNVCITDSTVEVKSKVVALNGMDILVKSSEIDAKSKEATGIFSRGEITIQDNSKIKTQGYFCGINSTSVLTISNTEINAVSLADIGVFSRKGIVINSGKVYVKGGPNLPAMASRVLKVSDEVASSKIDTGNLVEKNGGKVAFSDWFNVTLNDGTNETRSWTSFIGKTDTQLNVNNKGAMTNALNEVSLATPYTITFDVNGGNQTNFEETVYYGDKVGVPTNNPTKNGAHFNGWQLDGTQFDFENTVITSNLTLKANFTTHIPNADDGDCTTPIKCSTCNTITTEAKTHNWALECSKDNHWYKCQNAGCDSVKDKAAHTPGEEATKDHAQLCTVCGYELKAKLSQDSVIVDKTTGVKAEYVDGTEFDMNITLKVTHITPDRLNELNTEINKLEPKYSLAELYDIKLLMNGAEIQPSGKLKITIPINENMRLMSNLKVIYVDDNGNVTVIPSEVKNNTIVFITDHFSHYGVIGVEKEKVTPPTGDNNNIALLSTLLVSSFIITLINIKRRKTN